MVSPDRTFFYVKENFMYNYLIKEYPGYSLVYVNNFYTSDIASKNTTALALMQNRSTIFTKNFNK